MQWSHKFEDLEEWSQNSKLYGTISRFMRMAFSGEEHVTMCNARRAHSWLGCHLAATTTPLSVTMDLVRVEIWQSGK